MSRTRRSWPNGWSKTRGSASHLPRAEVLALLSSRKDDHPERARGALFTFQVKGGYEACVKLIDNVKLFSHVASLGDTRSLIIHSASTTGNFPRKRRSRLQAAPGQVRVSIGIRGCPRHHRRP